MGKKKARRWPDTPTPLAAPVTDNHTHLALGEWDYPRVDSDGLDLEAQLQRAGEVGVQRIITVGCSVTDLDPTVALTEVWRDAEVRVRAALAIHPNEAALHAGITETSPDGLSHDLRDHHVPLDEALAAVDARLDHPGVVAVGETGIDLYRTDSAGLDAQQQSFAAHIEMARRRDLPLQIHDREAHAETLDVLYDTGADSGDTPIVFHCFSGGVELAEHCNRHGWYASFGGSLTFAANDELRQAFLAMDPGLIVVETDAPYLTPVPERGHPNASYVMAHTVRFMAGLWEIDEEQACRRLEENTRRVYGEW